MVRHRISQTQLEQPEVLMPGITAIADVRRAGLARGQLRVKQAAEAVEPARVAAPPVGIAVVGVGHWGPNLIRGFASLAGCRLELVCDLDAQRLELVKHAYPSVRTTSRLADVLNDPEIQAVAVATPADTHHDVVMACLLAGKHVYVEKPIAINVADAESMVRTAEQTGRLLMVGHLFLYDAGVARLVEMLREDAVGPIRYVHGIRTSMAGTARTDTNILADALIHDAYVLPALFGRPPRRVLVVGGCYLNADLTDVAFATFDFGDGALAQIYVSWYALEKLRRLTVIGSRAILDYEDRGRPRLSHYDRRYERGLEVARNGRSRWIWRDDGARRVRLAPGEPLRVECQHFVDCLTNGSQPLSDGMAGLRAVGIIQACQQSLQAGGAWIEVDRW